MKVRRRKHDILFSQMIRRRGRGRCVDCGSTKNVDCAHIISRRHLATRWHPMNAITLCRKDHMFYTGHPFDWTDFCRDQYGGDFVAELRRVAQTTVKWTPADRESIYQHMQAEFANQGEGQDFAAHELMHAFETSPVTPLSRSSV